MDFKNIHIGQMIKERVSESDIDILRICKFFTTSEHEIEKMYSFKSIDSEVLLRWCKLLDYDFFRIYSQHLILYSPMIPSQYSRESALPRFKKNIYTKEIICFIINMIEVGEKTKTQVIEEYRIPKTTLHRWISKYKP
ncbi:transposase [Chryseobacterium pennae]|uniref:Transposase n=1 Tax=Chryseobacterium pennae TaxID=2258962 RepID=A0A3D9C7Y4_9FLAO|nr:MULTISPECIES: transposase [Chryseobacterium]MCS4301176.1 hypothetical protein [Chryseobacterium sp. BIGb0232]REC61993.1 transposase [Chryseobacterium pennae]ROS19963.1 hypothetical protein EDF65_0663 [Chryseobacterium nakagawai]